MFDLRSLVVSRLGCLFLLLLSFLAITPAAQGARVNITVQRQNGTPISDATLCLNRVPSTAADLAKFTNQSGVVTLEPVAAGSYRILAMKEGFISKQVNITVGNADQDVFIALDEGADNSGLACSLGYQVMLLQPVKILSFEINGGAESTLNRKVKLHVSFDRTPMYYRIAELRSQTEINQAFAGTVPQTLSSSNWVPYDPSQTISMSLGAADPSKFGTMYVAIQAKPGTDNASISRISVDSIVLKPENMTTYVVTGQDLKELVRKAKEDWGFSFQTRVSEAGTSPCPKSSQDKFDLYAPGVGMVLPADRRDVVGRYSKTVAADLFVGRGLNMYWEIKDIKFEEQGLASYQGGSGYIEPEQSLAKRTATFGPYFVASFKYSVVEPEIKVEGGILRSPRGCVENVYPLTKITLEGPAGLTWRDAFRR